MTKTELEELLPYANDSQVRKIEATILHNGNYAKAGIELGINESNVRKTIKMLKAKSASKMSPVEALNPLETPMGFSIDRISKHVNKEGEVSGWVIANKDKENMLEQWTEVISGLMEDMPRVKATPTPEHTLADLLCDYTIGDAHLGMKGWAMDTGSDWTLGKGVDILRKGVNHLVQCAPAAETAFILDTGDFMHSDNQSNQTTHSGNQLDVDGRWAEVLQASVQCIYDLIDLCLDKHKHIIFRSVIGNHNEHTAITLNMLVKMRYHDEPRVEVQGSPMLHNYYQFGCNLLADTHGHTGKAEKLPLLMAVDAPEMWASTTNRIWRTGHVHHLSVKEYPGAKVITYATLTPKDAWHTASGYRSNREMQMSIYHRDTGRVGSHYTNPTMLGY